MNFSARDLLKQYFDHETFRPLQEEVITAALNKKDVLAVMPTGAGKSVCFQVPALMMPGLCLVISPLVALMKDQVESLRKKGITGFAIHAGLQHREVVNILQVAGESNCKFLYVSPERLETNLFAEYLPSLAVSLIAVDEAHCISQWGYDFRPSYLRIAGLREELPDAPVIALTASATKEVQHDICENLLFKEHLIYQQPFERPNLSYSVFQTEQKAVKITDMLQKVAGSAIVYCKSRKGTVDMAHLLNAHGIQADHYHAGATHQERSTKQEAWVKDKLRVMVCTNAFGMGIDKPDVRMVIHADMPDCLENYYQEAGRAGRDGKRSYAALLYSDKELAALKRLPARRFPPIQKIRDVYQAIMNYLQIPSGTGQGSHYDFNISDFITKFSLDATHVQYAIKALEQEGWLALNEQVFHPSQIVFTTSKELLYEFQNAHPKLVPVIEVLLRTYTAVFDQPVQVREKNLAYLTRKNLNEVIDDLKKLDVSGILRYIPQKDAPQIYLLQDRIAVEFLRISQSMYEKRKAMMESRIASLIAYANEKLRCRSQLISNYFGDELAEPCGICDLCFGQKKRHRAEEAGKSAP